MSSVKSAFSQNLKFGECQNQFQQDRCMVCFDKFTDSTIITELACKHIFCQECAASLTHCGFCATRILDKDLSLITSQDGEVQALFKKIIIELVSAQDCFHPGTSKILNEAINQKFLFYADFLIKKAEPQVINTADLDDDIFEVSPLKDLAALYQSKGYENPQSRYLSHIYRRITSHAKYLELKNILDKRLANRVLRELTNRYWIFSRISYIDRLPLTSKDRINSFCHQIPLESPLRKQFQWNYEFPEIIQNACKTSFLLFCVSIMLMQERYYRRM